MPSVTISTVEYPTYADVDYADEYLAAAIHADTWRDAATTSTMKAMALVTATRIFDRQNWLDAYNTYDLRVVVEDIANASVELALALLDGSDVQNLQTTEERIQSISAGSVLITNFRGIDSTSSRFPQIVQELLQNYLGGGGSLSFASKATGVDTESVFPIDLGFGVGGL